MSDMNSNEISTEATPELESNGQVEQVLDVGGLYPQDAGTQ